MPEKVGKFKYSRFESFWLLLSEPKTRPRKKGETLTAHTHEFYDICAERCFFFFLARGGKFEPRLNGSQTRPLKGRNLA